MAAASEHDPLRVRRFDADRHDREISLEQALASSPTSRQLLWIDVHGDIEASELQRLGEHFEFDEQTRQALEAPVDRPHLAVSRSSFDLSVAAEPGGEPRTAVQETAVWLHVVAGRNVVVTRHAGPVALLDEIDDRIKADATVGAIEAAEFVGIVLDGVVTSYFAAVDEIEDAIDRLDARSLRAEWDHDLLDDLVRLRRRISRLRGVVTSHRSLFPALSGPDIRQLVSNADAMTDLQAVATRYEGAVAAVEASRSALLGSFDAYMTRTAQRTNDVVKVLTVATVLLLPGSVIAGLLGMNVVVPLNKDDPLSFWLVVAGMAVLVIVVLVALRIRRWI